VWEARGPLQALLSILGLQVLCVPTTRRGVHGVSPVTHSGGKKKKRTGDVSFFRLLAYCPFWPVA
jgi:hypothetical protein